MKEAIRAGFPSTISFPEDLARLCDWTEANGYPISGDFELRADDGEAIYWWFRSHAVDDRLAQFGAGPDGSLYCIWRQDDGRQPIVHLGSEGDGLMVLARDMREFIILLAIGYEEIGFDDLESPPQDADGINREFQKWVEETFGVGIPAAGNELVERAGREQDDFAAFVNAIVSEDG